MRLIPWNNEMEGMDLFMQPHRSIVPADVGIIPPVDIYEQDHLLIVETPLAGVDPEHVEVTVDGDMITIKGSMERKTEIDEKNYYRKEVRSGSVYRQIPLPVRVIGEKANASYERGMLKIEIPKAGEEKVKSIKINVK
jgi:HSP20 family protein